LVDNPNWLLGHFDAGTDLLMRSPENGRVGPPGQLTKNAWLGGEAESSVPTKVLERNFRGSTGAAPAFERFESSLFPQCFAISRDGSVNLTGAKIVVGIFGSPHRIRTRNLLVNAKTQEVGLLDGFSGG
jgi:hypothetical protein